MPDPTSADGSRPHLRLRDELALISATLAPSRDDLTSDDRAPVVVPWPHEPRPDEQL